MIFYYLMHAIPILNMNSTPLQLECSANDFCVTLKNAIEHERYYHFKVF